MRHQFRTDTWPLAVGLSALALLGACEDFPNQGTASGRASVSEGLAIEERDVEKPDIFSVRDMAVWDGRPSFGGVWVATSGDFQPERVSITNVDNQKTVVGALFKREEANPGPPIRLSSDAAAALGIAPGAPTMIAVTAVRREAVASAPVSTDPAAAAAVESEALEPVETPEATDETGSPTAAAATAATTTAATTTAVAADAAATTTRTRRPNFLQRIAMALEGGPKDEAPAVAAAPVVTDEVIAESTEPAISVTADPATAEAAAPMVADIDAAVAEVAAEAEAAAPAPVPPPARASELSNPYLQVAVFSTEENALTTVRNLGRVGIDTVVRPQTFDNGKTVYRVIAGPAQTEAEMDQLKAAVTEIGLADAFPVSE